MSKQQVKQEKNYIDSADAEQSLNPYCYGISSLTLRVVKGLYSGYNSGRNDVINKIMVTFVLFKEVQMYNLI